MKPYYEISTGCSNYSAEKAALGTLTVGELIEILRQADPDERIILTDYRAYTPLYGSLTSADITDHGTDDDEDF